MQGVVLIGLLALIGVTTAWPGIEKRIDVLNRWTWTSLALVIMTLLVTALKVTPADGWFAEAAGGTGT